MREVLRFFIILLGLDETLTSGEKPHTHEPGNLVVEENFVLYDGATDQGSRMIVFSTKRNLQILEAEAVQLGKRYT